jgi:hypothetical protein
MSSTLATCILRSLKILKGDSILSGKTAPIYSFVDRKSASLSKQNGLRECKDSAVSSGCGIWGFVNGAV